MRKRFLLAYERGYCNGLREAQARFWPDTPLGGLAGIDEGIELESRPAYQEGFTEGLKDGADLMRELRHSPGVRRL